jgi:hypothetical protein
MAALLAACVSVPAIAGAQSLCDLLPAPKVKALLDLNMTLLAVPDTEWGNGCDYSIPHASEPTVEADDSDDSGMDSLELTNHDASLNDDDHRISGLGELAIYTDDTHAQDPANPSVYVTRQSLIFRTDEKIIDFVIMSTSNSPTEAEVISLGKFAASEPLDNLKDPAN